MENGAPGEMGIRTLHAGDTDDPPAYAKANTNNNGDEAADLSSEDEAVSEDEDEAEAESEEGDETSDEEVSEG